MALIVRMLYSMRMKSHRIQSQLFVNRIDPTGVNPRLFKGYEGLYLYGCDLGLMPARIDPGTFVYLYLCLMISLHNIMIVFNYVGVRLFYCICKYLRVEFVIFAMDYLCG